MFHQFEKEKQRFIKRNSFEVKAELNRMPLCLLSILSNKLKIGAKVLVMRNSHNGPQTATPHCHSLQNL